MRNPTPIFSFTRTHRHRATRGALSLLALAIASSASASTLRDVSFQERLVRAELIADLTVVEITSRMSTAISDADAAMPHTFVTYRINDVMKGDVGGATTITVRYLGGTDDSGRVLRVAGIPDFRVGDRDLLFLQGNGERMCPLVGWEQGRFRIIGDEIFNEHGQELWITPDDRLISGEQRIDVRSRHPKTTCFADGHEDRSFLPPVGSLRPDAAGFKAIVSHLVAREFLRGMKAPSAVKNLEAAATFRVRALRESAPPPIPADTETSSTSVDHAEPTTESGR